MALVITTEVAAVVRRCEALVAHDPVAYTVFGSIAFGAQQDDGAPWAAYPQGSRGVLAARSQVHTTIGFTPGWTDAIEVAAAVAALDPPPAGLGGPPETVTAVAEAIGWSVTSRMDERLFRVDELVPPRRTDGSARLAGDADAPWLADWYTEFVVEAFGRVPPGFDDAQMVQRGVHRSRCWIWSDGAGVPRSFAVAQPPADGVSRIGPVYTPADARSRGYGSSATAAASRDILAAGNVACLYTDLANPTSNKIYQQLGYRPVLDRATLRFD